MFAGILIRGRVKRSLRDNITLFRNMTLSRRDYYSARTENYKTHFSPSPTESLTLDEWIVDILMAVMAFIAFIGFVFIAPESPQTLVQRERYADARELLAKYLKDDNDEIVIKMQCFSVDEMRGMPLKQVFRDKAWIERLVPVFGMAIFDALLGMRVIMMFLHVLMNATGNELVPVDLDLTLNQNSGWCVSINSPKRTTNLFFYNLILFINFI